MFFTTRKHSFEQERQPPNVAAWERPHESTVLTSSSSVTAEIIIRGCGALRSSKELASNRMPSGSSIESSAVLSAHGASRRGKRSDDKRDIFFHITTIQVRRLKAHLVGNQYMLACLVLNSTVLYTTSLRTSPSTTRLSHSRKLRGRHLTFTTLHEIYIPLIAEEDAIKSASMKSLNQRPVMQRTIYSQRPAR